MSHEQRSNGVTTNGVPSNGVPTNGTSAKAYPLEELSWSITKNASIVSHYLGANGLPQPSFASDGPATVVPSSSPHHIQEAQQKLVSAALEILQLAIGPSEFLPNLATGVSFEHRSYERRH